MARRRRDRMSSDTTYGGVRDTPRTRSPSRPVTTRVAAQRDPLDAIGGRFVTPDLSAFEMTPAWRPAIDQAPAKVRAARTVVLPSKRRAKEVILKAPDPLAKGRSANEFATAPTRSRLRAMGLTGENAPLSRSGGLLRGLLPKMQKTRLAPVSVPGNRGPKVTPRVTPTERPRPIPQQSVTGGTAADQRRQARLQAKPSPLERERKAASSCKPRPDPTKKTRGSGQSRAFIPWCKPDSGRR